MIELKKVSKWYGNFQVLTDCTTSVAKGDVVVVCGPSGSGKSTLIKTVNGLEPFQKGEILVDGISVGNGKTNLSKLRARIGMVFQNFELFPHLTVRQNVGFGLVRGWRNPGLEQQHAAIDHWLQQFDLQHLAHQFPDQISGGQRQRTALARALAAQPGALLLDEPFAALDRTLRVTLRRELDQLQQSLALPMILITHDPDDASWFGGDVLNLRDGERDGLEDER